MKPASDFSRQNNMNKPCGFDFVVLTWALICTDKNMPKQGEYFSGN